MGSEWQLSTQADASEQQYFAAKILTVNATRGHQRHQLEHLQAIRDVPGFHSACLPLLHDSFEESGPHGNHLCLVMNILSTDLDQFRLTAPRKTLPLYMVKTIIALIVDALVRLHDLNIIHTGLSGFELNSCQTFTTCV